MNTDQLQETVTDHEADPLWPKQTSPFPADPDLEQRINALLAEMSLPAKIGQMMQAEIRSVTPEDIRRYRLGSVLSGGGTYPRNERNASAQEWLAYADELYEAAMSENGSEPLIPIIWGIDAVHGHGNFIGATIFPHNIGLGAMNDPSVVEQIGRATALETAATGIDWIFAPTLAVVQDLRWGRSYEGYSSDPDIIAGYAASVVRGIQGGISDSNFQRDGRLIATAKHYIGDGGTQRGVDQGDNKFSEAELSRTHAAGYFTALDAGVMTVMASFSSWQGEKLHGHRYLLTDVLKKRLGFDGFVVGDWNGHGQVPGCSKVSCPQAIEAGIDMFMVPQDWKPLYENTLRQARDGEISIDRIDDAVRRILRVKIRAGLFDKGAPSSRSPAAENIGSQAHRELARTAVRQSLVLLKNNNNALPMDPSKTILLVGDAADDMSKHSGGWTISWQGKGHRKSDFPGGYSILDGFEQIITASGGQLIYRPDGDYDGDVDYVVAVYGESPYAEMHGDVATLEFQPGNKSELRKLQELSSLGAPVISVFLSGRPMWMNPEINNSDAFVAAWLPGSQGGAVADVLFATPSSFDFTGRLSFGWPDAPADPTNVEQPPSNLFDVGYGLSYARSGAEVKLLSEQGMAAAPSETDQLTLFDRDPVLPWQLFLQEDGDNSIKVLNSVQNGLFGTVSVITDDKDTQGDVRTVDWTGERRSRVYLSINNSLDLTDYRDGYLDFDFTVTKGQSDLVLMIGAGCGENCEALIQIDQLSLESVRNQWQRVSLPMACLSKHGLDLGKVDTVLIFESEMSGSVGFGSVVLQKSKGGGKTLPCP